MGDTDIDFLDFDSAREYVLAFLTTLKKTQKQRAVAEEELEHWRGRIKLAEARGEPALKRGAEQRVAELEAHCLQLHQEELELKRKVDVLKEKLKATKIRSSLQVDADALLAQMQMLVGEPDRLQEDMRKTEADQALRELKKKMGEGEQR
jgi:multidrug resistance efflux pump